MSDTNYTFEDILIKINEYMILDKGNDYIIDLLLAIALSIELDRPIWLSIIAPPSSGKTELLNILSGLKKFHILYNLTTRFLFSGHPSAGGGYMVREVKKKGIIAFPDFTTVLCLNSKSRNEIFNQLRVMYDGKAGLGTGIDAGKLKPWEGKIALIAMVTETIEKFKESASDLGERFLFFKFIPKDLLESENRNFTKNEETKKNIPSIVSEFLAQKRNEIINVSVSQEDKSKLYAFAKFICIGRAAVERDGHRREIQNVLHPEQPYRVMNSLLSLYQSLVCVNKDRERTIRIIGIIAFSSIPDLRKKILIEIFKSKLKTVSFDYLATRINKISGSKIRRTIEDMVAQEMLIEEKADNGNKLLYGFTQKFNKIWNIVISK